MCLTGKKNYSRFHIQVPYTLKLRVLLTQLFYFFCRLHHVFGEFRVVELVVSVVVFFSKKTSKNIYIYFFRGLWKKYRQAECDQRHILRDRRPITTAPACWVMGKNELESTQSVRRTIHILYWADQNSQGRTKIHKMCKLIITNAFLEL